MGCINSTFTKLSASWLSRLDWYHSSGEVKNETKRKHSSRIHTTRSLLHGVSLSRSFSVSETPSPYEYFLSDLIRADDLCTDPNTRIQPICHVSIWLKQMYHHTDFVMWHSLLFYVIFYVISCELPCQNFFQLLSSSVQWWKHHVCFCALTISTTEETHISIVEIVTDL